MALEGALTLGGAGLPITQAEARITGPEGQAETVALAVTGSRFSGEWAPASPGLHQVDLVVTAQTPDGTPIERTAFLAVEAEPRQNPMRTGLTLAAIAGALLCGLMLIVVAPVWLALRLRRRRKTR